MLYSIQENVLVVIALLKQYNINKIVISPGGTNIAISQAVQNDPFFTCYSIPDERSAMYFAIGLYLQTGEVIATSCTSAQATRNYIPGLTEAYYKHAPILAITTSKLERFQYQDYMQAPDQCSLPKDSVKCSYDLPPISDNNTRIMCHHRAKEAILETIHGNPGPVQLNIRIDDILQAKFDNVELPSIPHLTRFMAWDDWSGLNLKDKKILIVVGEHRPFTDRQSSAISAFCENYNVVVYVNHLSNYHGDYSINGNLLISCNGLSKLIPDIVITIGGQTGDYSIFGALNENKAIEHWRVSEDGRCVDTYNRLTKIFECPDYYFFERLSVGNSIASHSYYEECVALNDTLNRNVELPFSNLYVAQQMHNKIPKNSIMNFAILNSLRSWLYMPLDPSVICYSNVSAFGIDGCNSMLIGESVCTDELSFIVTGDLAFFYDMNALGIRHIEKNLRVLLINNGGGVEFRIMTKSWTTDVQLANFISAEGHNGSAKGWAENCGFEYLSANSKEEFIKNQDKFISLNDKPILFEVFTDSDSDTNAVSALIAANMISSGGIKAKLASIIGEKRIDFVKSVIH